MATDEQLEIEDLKEERDSLLKRVAELEVELKEGREGFDAMLIVIERDLRAVHNRSFPNAQR